MCIRSWTIYNYEKLDFRNGVSSELTCAYRLYPNGEMYIQWTKGSPIHYRDKVIYDKGDTIEELKAYFLVILRFSWSTFIDEETKNFSQLRLPKALMLLLFLFPFWHSFSEEILLFFLLKSSILNWPVNHLLQCFALQIYHPLYSC